LRPFLGALALASLSPLANVDSLAALRYE